MSPTLFNKGSNLILVNSIMQCYVNCYFSSAVKTVFQHRRSFAGIGSSFLEDSVDSFWWFGWFKVAVGSL